MFRVTHRNTAHVVIVLAVVSLILLVPAAPALAHATLIGAEPSPNTGTGLSNAPTTVRLRLSEPVRVPPSTIAVLDRSGRDVATRVRRVPTDPQSMEADLPSLSQGVYRVVWRSVSALDGHTIRGAYFFGVGEPPPGAPTETQSGPLSGAGLVGTLFRTIQDASLLLLLGLVAVSALAHEAVPEFAQAARRAFPAVAAVAFLGTLGTASADGLAASGWSAVNLRAYFTGSVAGWARVVAVGSTALALLVAARRTGRMAGWFAFTALAAVAVSGHAGATTHPVAFMAVNAAHVVSAGLWLGGAAAIALLWRVASLGRAEIVMLLKRASPYAVAAAFIVAATGALNALGELHSPSDLWRSGYGAVLDAKIAALVLAAAFGARHAFVLRPRLDSAPTNPGGASEMRGIRAAVSTEGWAAFTAVILATTLVAFPNPPAQEARAELQSSSVPAIFAIGKRSFVTVADHDGPLLISLTVAPPRPGDVVLAVQLINASGERTDGWPVDVEASGPGGETHSSRLTPCGPGCFKTDTPLSSRGVWRFDVDAQGHRAAFQLALPAPDGAAVLGQMRAAYNALRALQIDETFRSGTGLVGTTQYQYQAPDRSRLLSGDGREQITIGRLSYSRETQNRPWIKEDNPFPPGVPFPFIWSQAIEQPHLLPDAEINGRPVFVLALFDPFGIWFRVFVDKQTGRPIEDHMRAIGHFMDRTYSRFDRSIDIRAPT